MKKSCSLVATSLLITSIQTTGSWAQDVDLSVNAWISQVDVENPSDTGVGADDEFYFVTYPGGICWTPANSNIPEEGGRGIVDVEVPPIGTELSGNDIWIGVWEKGGSDYDCSTDRNAVEAGSDERLGTITILATPEGIRVNNELVPNSGIADGSQFGDELGFDAIVAASDFRYVVQLGMYMERSENRPGRR